MGRKTKEQKLREETVEEAVAFFEQMLAGLPDPRRRQGVRYPLRTVVVTALMAMVCGADDATAMEVWGKANEEWLEKFLDMPHGPATQDVYLSVFGALDPDSFEAVFRSWAHLLALRLGPEAGKHIAVDGKTSRRSFDTASGAKAIHTVSAWMTEAGLLLGQQKTEKKSNEITAIPKLLKVLDLTGATVTIDAMGCQTKIAQAIRDGGGHYVFGTKGNQHTLKKEIEATFSEVDDDRQRALDELPRPHVEVFEEVDKGHGRIEKRRVRVCRDLQWFAEEQRERWPDLAFVVEVTRERENLTTSKRSTETSYYIGSDRNASAEKIARTIRRHWSIENSLHYVLDVAFGDDQARHRAKNAAENMMRLRRYALNIIKHSPGRKVGVANSRKRAGWDRNYLLELLTGIAV